MSLDWSEHFVFLLKYPSCHFLCQFSFRTQGWYHPVSLNQVQCTPWVLFPLWFPALVPVVCLFLSWLSSQAMWETEAKSGSIALHFYSPCVLCCWRTFTFLPQALWDPSLFPFVSAKIIPVSFFLHIGPLSYLCTDLFSFLWIPLLSSLHVQDSALQTSPPDCWKMWGAAAADGEVCFSSAEYPDFSVGVACCRLEEYGQWMENETSDAGACWKNQPSLWSCRSSLARALSLSALCCEMKAGVLAEYFLSHSCFVFGHDSSWELGRDHKVHLAVGWAQHSHETSF